MSFARKEPRVNHTAGLAFPRPTRPAKEPKRLRPRPAAPGERPKFSTLSRSGPIKHRSRRHIARNVQHAGYLAFIHGERCCETGRYGTDANPIEANHAHVMGIGLKASDYDTFPLLRSVHREWTEHRGRFEFFDRDQRRAYEDLHLTATHNRWLALPEDEREAYQVAALAEREAMRAAAKERRSAGKHTAKRCTKPNCVLHPGGVRK